MVFSRLGKILAIYFLLVLGSHAGHDVEDRLSMGGVDIIRPV